MTNPDGATGILLHFDAGDPFYGSGGNFIGIDALLEINGDVDGEFLGYKAAHFAQNRAGYFHYLISCDKYAIGGVQTGSTGLAEILGNDFVASVGQYRESPNFRDWWLENTILHELGHNLGLRHGGNVNLPNWKPNYNSVMNYRFQLAGVDADCDGVGDIAMAYSQGLRPQLDENAVIDADGVCGPGSPIDWNSDGRTNDPPYRWDLNIDINSGAGDGLFQVLTDHDDWAAASLLGVLHFDRPSEVVICSPLP